MGIKAVLSTNGTLLDGDLVGKLADAGLSYIGISSLAPAEARQTAPAADIHDRGDSMTPSAPAAHSDRRA